MKTINNRGFAHFAALALVIVAVATFGTYTLVSSNAQTPLSNRQTALSTAAPKSTADCTTAPTAGANYYFDGTRCVTLQKPLCKTGATLVATKNNANLDVYYCNQSTATTKPVTQGLKTKATYTLTYGAHKAGQAAIGLLPELVAQSNDVLEFNVIVTNIGTVPIENAVVNINGLNTAGLRPVPGSLTLDGKQTTTEILKRVRLCAFPAKSSHTITFRGQVGDNVSACGNRKMTSRATFTAKAVATQTKSTIVQVCPQQN